MRRREEEEKFSQSSSLLSTSLCRTVAPSPHRPVSLSPCLPVSLSPCLPVSLSSVSLLSAQIEHKDNRLCVVAGDNDSLFERENQPHDLWIQLPTGRIGRRKGPDIIFARKQTLEEKLSPRINIRVLTLRRLIHPARNNAEPETVRRRAANNLQLTAKLERAVSQNEAHTGQMLSSLYFNPIAHRRPIMLDSRKNKTPCV